MVLGVPFMVAGLDTSYPQMKLGEEAVRSSPQYWALRMAQVGLAAIVARRNTLRIRVTALAGVSSRCRPSR